MWLCDSFCYWNLCPDNCFIFRADRDYIDSNGSLGGSVLTAVYRSFPCSKLRYELELACEYVWTEIPIPDVFNLLVVNRYFPPNTDIKVSENYFNCLKTNLNP
jgi:hypothetical protein